MTNHVAQLNNVFADKVENEEAHHLLQKNLKNLFNLFVAMKSDIAGQDDPMFTAKPLLNCASCAKGVTNINGFRADNSNWNAMPLRDPASRMLKSGLGFSKIFD